MKINSIRLRNVRCHADTTVALDRLTFIVGRNASGKTSILEALEYALTGRCGVTDERGAGAEALIQVGAQKAQIDVDIEGIGTVTRAVPNALTVPGVAGSLQVQQQALYAALGATEDQIRAVLSTSRFLSLKPADQKSLLFAALGIGFPTGLADALGAELSETELAVARLIGVTDLMGGPEILDAAYGKAFDARRDAKKRLADLKARLNGPEGTPTLPGGVTMADKPAVVAQLAEVAAERDKLLREAGAAEAAIHRRDGLTLRYQEVDMRARTPLPESDKLLEAQVRALEKSRDGYAATLAKLDAKAPAKPEDPTITFAALDQAIAALENAGDTCPLVRGMTCVMGPAERGKLLDQYRQTRTQGLAGYQEAQDAYAVWAGKRQEAAAKQQEVVEQITRLQADAQAAATRRQAIQEAKAECGRIRDEIQAIGAVMPPEALRAKVEELDQRLSRGQALLRDLEASERAFTAHRSLLAEARDAGDTVDALEKLCEVLGPKGLKARLLNEAVLRLQAQADQSFKALTGGAYDVRFAVEPDLAVWVAENGGVWRPASTLSASEKWRLGIVLQDVLASLAGVGVLCIDEADQLDPINRDRLTEMLLLLAERYDSIILCATTGAGGAGNPGIPGVAVYELRDGQAVPVVAEVESHA